MNRAEAEKLWADYRCEGGVIDSTFSLDEYIAEWHKSPLRGNKNGN